MAWPDIAGNLISDIIFFVGIASIVWIANMIVHRRRLADALRFFNFDQEAPLRMFVSGFEHPGVKTKRVVNAVELQSAILLRDVVKNLTGEGTLPGLVTFLGRMIGIDISYPEPIVQIAPLEEASRPLPYKSVALVGGPVANTLTKFYLGSSSPTFRFDADSHEYQMKEGTDYRAVPSSHDFAAIEKIVNEDQVVLLIHGFGEEDTDRAVRYLIENWRRLSRRYGRTGFGVAV